MSTFEIVAAVAIIVWSITTHEVAHAWVADLLGDDTARQMGRITLNPLPHIDPFMTVIVPIIALYSFGVAFGGAKPVMVNIYRLRKPRRDWALVGLAGPVSNILIAIACAGLLSILLHTGYWTAESSGVNVLSIALFVNLALAVFNLLPLPPLDGSRVVQYFLRGEALRAYQNIERFGLFILIGLLVLFPGLLYEIITSVLEPLMYFLTDLFGIRGEVVHSVNQVLFGR
jgi:Zn-dependent protease